MSMRTIEQNKQAGFATLGITFEDIFVARELS